MNAFGPWFRKSAALVCLAAAATAIGIVSERSVSMGESASSDTAKVELLTVEIVKDYPHDPVAFTQGLVWDDGIIFESTGLYGRSKIRRVSPETGEVLLDLPIAKNLFGEGLALVGDRLIQLTWRAGIALVFDPKTLASTDQYSYNGDGWGLAFDGKRLAMSDGSSRITFRNPIDFSWQSTLQITENSQPLADLNELEFAEGDLYANVFGQDRIVRIDPSSGRVTASVDAAGILHPAERARVDVLNGIAYDPDSRTFWLTGKFWSRMFQTRFVRSL